MGLQEKFLNMAKEYATIEDAKLFAVFDLWRHKPKGLAFNDTDVIVVTAKTKSGSVKETFYTCIKGNGTFSIKTPNRNSQHRRQMLANFLKSYLNVKNPEEYNIKEGIKTWKGKKVEVVKSQSGDYINTS